MDDEEKLIKTFQELNISFEHIKEENKVRGEKYNSKIRIDQGLGYNDFYTEFYFLNGEIVHHAVWE